MAVAPSRWQRETRFRNQTGRLQGDVAYYAPCGKKLRQYQDVVKVASRPRSPACGRAGVLVELRPVLSR